MRGISSLRSATVAPARLTNHLPAAAAHVASYILRTRMALTYRPPGADRIHHFGLPAAVAIRYRVIGTRTDQETVF